MKNKFLPLAMVSVLSAFTAVAQTPSAAPVDPAPPAPTGALPAPKEDFKPASSNLPGKDWPQVNSERRVRYRVVAPQATSVKVGRLELTKGADGAWMGTSEPRDEGAHFYTINIDGAETPDPNSMVVGAYRLRSNIEIPAADQDFYALKNVPHGQMREVRYFAKSSGSIRRIYVYTPPDYEMDVMKRYPVLYLQHGSGEDESLWTTQGRTGLIMDNLIAAGKAKPFIIVMEGSANTAVGPDGAAVPQAASPARGGAPAATPAAPGTPATTPAPPAGRGGMGFTAFARVMTEDLIPYIDANFRTLANQANRGMAGLSLGGMQTRSIGLSHLDQFSHIGVFSGGSITAEEAAAIPDFKEKVKLVFVSYGSREIDRPAAARGGGAPGGGRGGNASTAKADIEALKQAGINAHFYVSPETAHEWQSWRRSLHEFAPLLFKDDASTTEARKDMGAAPAPAQPAPGRPGGRSGGLAPTAPQAPEEGMAAYPVPPGDFKSERATIPHGEVKVVEYDSKTLGTRRLMRVYTPPGYSTDRKYPVLYLHHGLGNTSTEWLRAGAKIIADNLLADGKMEPMIIVFPQGSAGSTAADENQGTRDGAGFGPSYESDLLKDIIPFVESQYSTIADRDHRAIAGMSMGGGQTLNIGLSHLDVFGSVAAVAAAPNTKPVATLIPDPAALKQLNLLWLGVGNRDPLMRNSVGVHTFLLEKQVPHLWRLDAGAHDSTEMGHNFYHFAQLLFKQGSDPKSSDNGTIPKQAGSTENANLPVPPTGWDAVKEVPHGEVRPSLSYPTRNHGEQLYSIWLPPGYTTDRKYPVLYMLHGLGDNQTTWINQSKGRANNILDNYLADKKIVPMLVVFPNGALGETGNMGNFGKFGEVLIDDLIPHIDKTYSTSTDPLNRALGGLSMGGGQTLKFGLPRTDLFNWIGAFAPAAPNAPAQNIPDPSVIRSNMRYIYLAVGTADGRMKVSTDQYHQFFDDNGITHIYQLEQGLGHDWNCFNRCFYNYVPHLFTGASSGVPMQ